MKGGLQKEDRKCTDCICLLIFIAFVGCMGFLTSYGLKYGDMNKLMAPLDGDDNFCGVNNGNGKGMNLTSKPYLYLPELSISSIKDIFADGVCVDECPKSDSGKINFQPNSAVPDNTTLSSFRRYNTKKVLGYCFPTVDLDPQLKAGWKAAKNAFLANPIGKYFNDMYLYSTAMFISVGMSLVYTILYILILSAFAEPLAWICIVAIQLGLFGVAVGAWFMRQESIKNLSDAEPGSMTEEQITGEQSL